MKKSSLKKLIAIYDAIGYLHSESPDPFDQAYVGGTNKLLDDFETILKECGAKFLDCVKGQYYIAPCLGFAGKEWEKLNIKPRKQWFICTNKDFPNKSIVLSGFDSPEKALAMLNDFQLFPDYNGKAEIITTIDLTKPSQIDKE